MYLDICRYKRGNRTYRRVLLREGYRENGKVKHRTIANLSRCSDEEIEAIKTALKYKKDLAALKDLAEGSYYCGKHVGAVAMLYQVANRLSIIKALGVMRNGLLALWLVMARLIDQGSRLSAVRLAQDHAVGEILNLDGFNEDNLYRCLDWLCKSKGEIEDKLFNEGRKDRGSLFLYDVTSCYLEGERNAFAAYGYNRDKKKGKKQLEYGLLTDDEGDPVSIGVFKGNTSDHKTVVEQIKTLRERFGCEHITLVGDKGMLKSGEIEALKEVGFHYITSISKSQIRSLMKKGTIQLSLFDEELHEVEDMEEGIRYILRRNPIRARETSDKRYEKIDAVKDKVHEANKYLRGHSRAKAETQVKRVNEYISKLKINSILSIEVTEDRRELQLKVNGDALLEASLLDGCYVIKTDLEKGIVSKEVIHDRYKALSEVEWAFRTQKTDYLEVRPVYVRKKERTIGHLLVVMLAYKVERYLRNAWKDLDITVEGGIRKMGRITSNVIKIGEKELVTVGEPDEDCRELLKRLDVNIPKVLPCRESHVATRKKLSGSRKLK